jgi:flagellar assembly protein FliH
MILLSNVIKSSFYVSIDDKRLIEAMEEVPHQSSESYTEVPESSAPTELEDEQTSSLKRQILRDAEQLAEERIRQALEQCSQLKEQAQKDIEQWWHDQRALDEQHIRSAEQSGFDQGYADGRAQAEIEVQEQYAAMLDDAKRIIEQAGDIKQQMIREADPFLIELSCAIAEKVIGRQLSLTPEWIVDIAKTTLSRRRGLGTVTLCVSPAHFSFIQAARDELLLALDTQAELIIVPDNSVRDEGCVVRSAFGAIDARIDTQMKEIKSALMQAAAGNEGAANDD